MITLLQRIFKEMKARMMNLSPVFYTKDTLIREGHAGDSNIEEVFGRGTDSDAQAFDRNNLDEFYFHFENIFRGSMEGLKKSQSIYVPYVAEARSKSKGSFFLDAGCGRCEFLSLLQHQGIPVKGVDTNSKAVDLGKKMNLDVLRTDAVEYLKTLEDASLIGLSMFQVIEHLDFKSIDEILKIASTKISPNGIIIIESVNPHCPTALGNFYLDPTHMRPYPPDLMCFMLEWHGFQRVKIIYSSPVPRRIHFWGGIRRYQDYAVLGKKQKGKNS